MEQPKEKIGLSPGFGETNPGSAEGYKASPTLTYEVLSFKEGEVIFKEGVEPRGVFYIHSGIVKIVVHQERSKGRTTSHEYITKLAGPGEYFGHKAIIKGSELVANAKAIKPTIVWLYPKDQVEELIKDANPLIRVLLKQVVSDLETYEKTAQLNYLASVEERIAHTLYSLAEKFGVSHSSGTAINLRLTRNEFAQLASTINESLSRHLTDFKNEGLIELNGKEIVIKDKNALLQKF